MSLFHSFTKCIFTILHLPHIKIRDEVKRNRSKISEITYFLQIQREEMERAINIPQIDEDMQDEN